MVPKYSICRDPFNSKVEKIEKIMSNFKNTNMIEVIYSIYYQFSKYKLEIANLTPITFVNLLNQTTYKNFYTEEENPLGKFDDVITILNYLFSSLPQKEKIVSLQEICKLPLVQLKNDLFTNLLSTKYYCSPNQWKILEIFFLDNKNLCIISDKFYNSFSRYLKSLQIESLDASQLFSILNYYSPFNKPYQWKNKGSISYFFLIF
jgi:hypothetical protein